MGAVVVENAGKSFHVHTNKHATGCPVGNSSDWFHMIYGMASSAFISVNYTNSVDCLALYDSRNV